MSNVKFWKGLGFDEGTIEEVVDTAARASVDGIRSSETSDDSTESAVLRNLEVLPDGKLRIEIAAPRGFPSDFESVVLGGSDFKVLDNSSRGGSTTEDKRLFERYVFLLGSGEQTPRRVLENMSLSGIRSAVFKRHDGEMVTAVRKLSESSVPPESVFHKMP